MAVMAVGVGFVALLTAYVADRFVTESREAGKHETEVTAALERIEERLESPRAAELNLSSLDDASRRRRLAGSDE